MPMRGHPCARFEMMVVRRFDLSGTIGKIQRTPQGGIRVDAALTRAGIFEYVLPDGSVRREYRDPAEVFVEDSIETLRAAPVTRLHPADMVTPDTWKDADVIGHVDGAPAREEDLVVAQVVIQDADAIDAIDREKMREVSCGYVCELDLTPGELPSGERYDARQTKIRYNHVALVPRGRAGREVALRLDAEGNQVFMTDKKKDPEQDQIAKILAKKDEKIDQLTKKIEDLESQIEKFDELVEAEIQAREARAKLMQLAGDLGVKIDESEKDLHVIRRQVLLAMRPSLEGSADLESPDYVRARLDAALEAEAEKSDAAEARKKIDAGEADAIDDHEAPDVVARRKMIERADALKEMRTCFVVRKEN